MIIGKHKSKLDDSALYAQYNGMILCGAHSGMTAQATGRCLDGHKLDKINDAWIKREGDDLDWRCESCGIDRHGAKDLSWDYKLEIRGGATFTGRTRGVDIREAFEHAIETHGVAGVDVALFHIAEGD